MVTEPRKYQACSFFFTFDMLIPGPSNETFTVVELITTQHLQLGATPALQIIMPSAAKGAEVGGLVWNYEATVVTVSTNPGETLKVWNECYWDRLDAASAPIFNPATAIDTQSPISVAPLLTESNYPMRWIQRDFCELGITANAGLGNVGDCLGKHNRTLTHSKRIRRRIGDREGLYLSCMARSDAAAANNASTLRWSVAGTLYYRWLFQ